MSGEYRSGDALFAFGEDRRVCAWNAEAERLTGFAQEEVVGRPCWDVFAALDRNGGLVCHPGCSRLRLIRSGWPVGSEELLIRTTDGRRRVTVSTVTIESSGDPLYLHVFRNGEQEESPGAPQRVRLTRRQEEILELLAEGKQAKLIAHDLGIAEATVRNHIRMVLAELRCHSQLEAVAEARRLGVLR